MPHVMTPRMTSAAKEHLGSTLNSTNKKKIVSCIVCSHWCEHAHTHARTRTHTHTHTNDCNMRMFDLLHVCT